MRQAKKLGNNIGRFMSLLLSGVFPWAKLRQAQKLMRLADKYGHARVETACQRALGFDLINVQRVERILKNAVAPSDDPVLCQNSPSRHRRKNRASRNQTQTLARERVTRRPPTFDCRSTHRWRRRVRPARSSHRSMTGLNRAIKAGSTFCGAQGRATGGERPPRARRDWTLPGRRAPASGLRGDRTAAPRSHTAGRAPPSRTLL